MGDPPGCTVVTCRRRRGGPRQRRRRSISSTVSIASSRRTHRLPFVVHETILAWATRGSVRRPSRCVTATSRSSRGGAPTRTRPLPLDPNLISQGCPARRPDLPSATTSSGRPRHAPPPPGPAIVAPSAFPSSAGDPGPSVAVAQYSPSTGQYVTPDGHAFRQLDLAPRGRAEDLEGHAAD